MNPTTEQLNNRLVATGQSPAPVPKTMDGATLGTQSNLKLASQQTAPIPDISTLAVAQPAITEPEKPQAQSTLSQRLAGLITASKGKEADVASSVSQATSPYTQQLNEINTQIKLLQANSIARQEKALQAGETQGFASREAQNVQRTDAIEALKLSALQAGLQGNIALAEQQATNAVNAKYAQNEKDIEDAKTNIYNNYDSLSPAEKKQADATLLRLDADDAFVKQRKEDEKAIQNLGLELARNGADMATVQKAIRSGNINDAMVIGSKFLSTPDNQIIQTSDGSTLLIDKRTGETIRNFGGGTGGGNPTENLIDAGLPVTPKQDPSKTEYENNLGSLQDVFQSSKVSAANKTSIGNALSLAKAASDLAEANAGGKFTGLYPGRSVLDFIAPAFLKRGKTVANESLISALDLQTQFWASGAALSEEQTKLVQKMIPTKNDTDKAIKAKTNQLVNYMLSQTASRLTTDGINFQPTKIDLFETPNLIERASPEQLEQLKAEGLI